MIVLTKIYFKKNFKLVYEDIENIINTVAYYVNKDVDDIIKIQETAFGLGYKWGSGSTSVKTQLVNMLLFDLKDKKITYSDKNLDDNYLNTTRGEGCYIKTYDYITTKNELNDGSYKNIYQDNKLVYEEMQSEKNNMAFFCK